MAKEHNKVHDKKVYVPIRLRRIHLHTISTKWKFNANPKCQFCKLSVESCSCIWAVFLEK